jgi:serine/threonine protein phosphatase PrpC
VFKSHEGNRKKINQDNVLLKSGECKRKEFGPFAVATVWEGFMQAMRPVKLQLWRLAVVERKAYELIYKGCLFKDSYIDSQLETVFNTINLKIKTYGSMTGQKSGTTLTVLFICKDRLFIKHIGDSRVYLINSGIKKLTKDHSWVTEEVLAGRLTADEARVHPKRNILTQCLGVKDEIITFTIEGSVEAQDSFLVCSDGFYGYFSESEIYSRYTAGVKDKIKLQDFVCTMVDQVISKGAHDNVSVILVRQVTGCKNKNSIFNKIKTIV